jgi:alpha-N-arabinofuranosidase
MKLPLSLLALLVAATPAFAAEIHVAKTGADTAEGSASAPLKTISAAAQKAMPGDTVTVHAGVYRERVDPPRGGESDTRRIVYQAAPGEKVVITGSDEAKGWEKVSGDTWKLTLPNKSFGHFNPYADVMRGDWFGANGRVHHTGCVYVNGDWLVEATSLGAVMKPAGKTGLWFATVEGDSAANLMNLGKVKPSGGAAVSGGEPSFRYGGRPAASSEGGECSAFIRSGHWLRFDGVDFGAGSDSVELRAAAAKGAGGVIELRLDTPEGEFLGSCEIAPTGDWKVWKDFTAKIKPVSGKRTLCVLFKTAKLDTGNTVIHAQFPGVNPNEAPVEINRRQTVFYPSKNHINHLTVRGFTLLNAATNWAPPSSEQTAVIGTNWSKGWIIEDNEVAYSKCSGISLGKYGDGLDNTNNAGAADPYTRCVRDALKHGWNKATVGSHLVRNNRIHHSEQVGIVGSMGCAYSTVVGNEVYDINTRHMFSGAEQAGVKFHGFIDGTIRDNHIYRAGNYGLWLDWMCQGAQITGNLFHDNAAPDIFSEMQHGPLLFANNLFLSSKTFWFISHGIAVSHNLLAGGFKSTDFDPRNTPFHPAHATDIAGLLNSPAGDHRFYNNLAARGFNGGALNASPFPCFGAGGVFTKGASPSKFETDTLVKPDFDAKVKLTKKADGWYLSLAEDPAWKDAVKRPLVTTKLLGLAKVPNLPYENADGTPLAIDTDYFGKKRDASNPFPGPFETPVNGEVKVWPKR